MNRHVRMIGRLCVVAFTVLSGCGDGDALPSGEDGTGGHSGGDAGAGGADGAGGANASGGAPLNTGGITPPADDQGEGDGKDVVAIGDSYMSFLSVDLVRSLRKITGRTYRSFAFPGTLVLDGAIPAQYDRAVEEDSNIKTVVMTGGGNDILASECDGACEPLIDEISARLTELRQKMGQDGVRDVIVVGYGYTVGTRGPALAVATDYYRGRMAEACRDDGPPPRCHFVDPVEALKGKIGTDGVHPTGAGYDALAKLVWERMQAEGVRR